MPDSNTNNNNNNTNSDSNSSSGSKKIFGIDLSHHNGAVDFNKVKAAGVQFVILRCGYASTSNRNSYGKDKKFEEYYSAAKSAGLAIGTYFYSMCNSKETGKAEAEFILKTIAGKTFEYPVWLDVENTSNLNSANKETMTDAVETCLETIKAAGYKVGIYTGVYIARDNLVQSRIDKYDVWIAQWSTSCSYSGNLCMWQFGGETNKIRSVKVDGVSSAACDQNYSFVDYAAGETSSGKNNPFGNGSGTGDGSGGAGGGGGNLSLIFNNTTTTQESLPNANVSDNWVDMHKIKGITLHMYPPYHNCVADSMVKSFEALGWDRNFHYKVDKDTKVDFDAKPVSGEGTGGNKVGSSVSVFEIVPKDPLNYSVMVSGGVTNAGGGSGGTAGGDGGSATPGGTIDGSDVPSKIYNYCVSQGCSCAAACGVVGNAQVESNFSTTVVNKSSGATGLFQWLGGRLTALKSKASAAGKDYTDADIQIQHMWAEFCGEDSTTLSLLNKNCGGVEGFKKLSSAGEAGKMFGKCFERAGDNGSTRASAAEQWYQKFSQMQNSGGGNSGGTGDTGQDATPLSLTPTAEITPRNVWYQDNSQITEEDLNKPATMPELGEDVLIGDGIMTVETKKEPFGWPIPGQKYIQSYYGYRSDVLGYKFHSGIDIVNYPRSGAFCYADGRVMKVQTDSVLNGYVRVDHGNGVQTVYGALERIFVEEGAKVYSGQCIGTTYNSEANPLYHLHFAMIINGKYVDPLYYVKQGGGNRRIPENFGIPNVEEETSIMTIDNYGVAPAASVQNGLWIGDSRLVAMRDQKIVDSTIRVVAEGGKAAQYFLNNYASKIESLKGGNFSHIAVLLGVNDPGSNIKSTKNLLTKLRTTFPSTPIYMMQPLPATSEWRYTGLTTVTGSMLKEQLAKFRTEVGNHCATVGDCHWRSATTTTLVDSNGYLIPKYAIDGVHLTTEGYKIYYQNIVNILNGNSSDPNDPGTDNGGTGNGGSGTGNMNQGDSLGDSTVGDSGEETYDPGRENPIELSWDNVDKGRILFASADNNTHTYIDANLFNNQHPKYTLSIGSFFYDEYDLVEKSADVDYPATEKILIQQCAKALYDEGFTSKELWREFDLNRAPSPFLYLDREKWIAFCAEVDKQVEWLNKKYGKVTATYKSNALLKNYHRNEFVESAPMPVGGTGGSGGSGDGSGSSGSGGAGGAGFLWPAPGNTRISSPFGPRKAPTAGASTNHKGIDIPGPSNSQIIASKGGKVSVTKSGSASAGNYVAIEHDGGYTTRYLHLNSYSVTVGQTVNQGDEIGKMGNTGVGTGVHLHFEVHENGTPVDPQKYVDPSNSKANAESDKDKESTDNGGMGEGTLVNANYGIALAEGNVHPASFSAYIPTGNPTANGEKTDPSKNTCAAPSEVPFGTKIKVMETGTDKDGQIYTVNDRGGGIKIKNGVYYIDLLMGSMSEATQFGRRSGKVEIGASGDGGSSDGGTGDGSTGGDSTGGASGGVFSPSGLPIGGKVNQSAWDEEPKYATGDENSYSGLTESGLGASSIDNGGIMEYEVGSPEDPNAPQPEIATIITQEEYEAIMEFAKPGEIDIYVNSFEPYDKDLDIAKTIGLTDDTRLETLTETVRTLTENMIRYKVAETGPGSIDHCVKPVDELSVLYKTSECKVEPVYPDLVIPPKYVTSEYDTSSPNSIPVTTIEDATAKLEDMMDKSMSYDYELLDEVTKKSSGKPINYYDPYPYDDKIADLEDHSPKVLIDEIESRLYSCNHPGCPIAHPMAKNFAMLNDMAINQSKYTEQRLVRLENILSTMIRYLGRMSSRMNINCVYYGGQTVMGKYKCIRCLRDDRVHDGATVTMDQCLTCTRYEPIIGQVYDILDETGFNGSAILDDMQMSYMSLNDMKNLNKVENRSTVYWYADTNKKEDVIPTSLIDEWKKADREAYLKKIEEEGGEIKTEGDSDSGKKDENYGVMPIDNTETDTETNTEEKEKDPNKILPSEYLFMMDWNTQAVDLQKPDVKEYPTEKIAAKYFNQASDPGEDEGSTASAEKSVQISLDTDKEVYESISSGEWVDTRTEDDSLILNRYTSLDYYFDKFNLNRTGYEYDNGLAGNVGLTASGGSGGGSASGSVGSSVNGTGSEIRKKIVEHAYKIVADHKAGKATYCSSMRTVDPDKPVVYPGTLNGCTNPVTYDCTSFVSCCYKAAGLTSFFSKSASGGSLIAEAKSGGYEMWLGDEAGFAKALPGDVLVKASSGKISNFDASNPPAISHAMIYSATNEISHASQNKPVPDAIKTKQCTASDSYYGGRVFFIRCKELIDADKAAEQKSNIEENPNGDNNGDSGSNNSKDNNNGSLKMPSDGAVAINAGIATASTINTNNNTITTKPSDIQKETIVNEVPISPSYSSEPAYILSSELKERNNKYMIDGHEYACKLSYARCTEHGPWDGTSTVVSKGWGAIANRICGSHNLPCGTKIYIPEFKGVINPDGIFTVRDNGKHAFDFSIATSRAFNITGFYTVYVLSYGSGPITESFTETKRRVDPDAVKYASAWKEYMRFGGCLINFGKFNNQDIMATWWRK